MKIEHIAIWTTHLEEMKGFYVAHFGCQAGPRYKNEAKQFESYFLRFENGARLEIMQKQSLASSQGRLDRVGFAHIALSTGSEEAVRQTTERLRAAKVPVVSEPRWTGDGYFESTISDPDGNVVEITI